MATSIRWHLMFRVGDRPTFDRCLAGALPMIGPDREAQGGQPYWKIPELWECTVVPHVADGSVAEQVLGCLLAAQRLASGWHIL